MSTTIPKYAGESPFGQCPPRTEADVSTDFDSVVITAAEAFRLHRLLESLTLTPAGSVTLKRNILVEQNSGSGWTTVSSTDAYSTTTFHLVFKIPQLTDTCDGYHLMGFLGSGENDGGPTTPIVALPPARRSCEQPGSLYAFGTSSTDTTGGANSLIFQIYLTADADGVFTLWYSIELESSHQELISSPPSDYLYAFMKLLNPAAPATSTAAYTQTGSGTFSLCGVDLNFNAWVYVLPTSVETAYGPTVRTTHTYSISSYTAPTLPLVADYFTVA